MKMVFYMAVMLANIRIIHYCAKKHTLAAMFLEKQVRIVDKIIQLILDTMLEDTRLLTNSAEDTRFLFRLNDGTLSLAKSGQIKNISTSIEVAKTAPLTRVLCVKQEWRFIKQYGRFRP